MATIVIVDDEPDLLDLLRLILEADPEYTVLTTTNPHEALSWCRSRKVDVFISDVRMPEMEGIELLKIIKRIDPNLPVILITAFGTVESAVEAMRHNAFDYITKPFKKEHILLTVKKALQWRQTRLETPK